MKIAKKVNCAPRLIASYTNLNLVSPFSNLFLIEKGKAAPIANKKNGKTRSMYDYLDGQEFFTNPVEHRYRSTMNVTFTSPNPDMDKKFCAEAAEAGFVNLKGHRLVGGMRASIYNAMPAEGVDKLVDFMEKFRKENA